MARFPASLATVKNSTADVVQNLLTFKVFPFKLLICAVAYVPSGGPSALLTSRPLSRRAREVRVCRGC